MIVGTSDLVEIRGRVTMVDGGFDPLHGGHVSYFRTATELGLPVLCSVSPDEWVMRKHPPFLPQADRVQLIDAIRWVDYVHASRSSTAEVLRVLAPRYYAKGKDWSGRLPAEEIAICQAEGIELVYLDTVSDSSSRLLEDYRRRTAKWSSG